MTISLEQLSAQMRRGEQVPLRHTMQVVLTLSIPSILQQIVVTAVEYIDAAMVGHIGASATASIGIVSSSTWLMHGMLAGLYMSFAIQVAQYLGADRQADARGVLRQSMIFNLAVGLAAAAFGIGISRFLPGWLGADPSLRADASAYFAIWSASLPFLMVMGTYSSMLRSCGDALTPGLISVLTCVLDVIFNFFLINPTRQMTVLGRTMTVWGLGWGVPGAALGTAFATAISGTLTLALLLLRDGPLCIRKPGSWQITRACLQNLWKVGTPLAAERAALSSAQVLLIRIVSGLGTTAIAANSLGVSAESLCYMAGYGIQDAPCTGRSGCRRKPPGYVQTFCMAVHLHGRRHHGSDRCRHVSVCAQSDGHLHRRHRSHCTGCAGAADRSCGRADVRCQHRCQRCHAGRGRQCRLLCAEPRQHVGHPAHPCHPAGPAFWAGGRVVCHEL